MKAMSPDIHTRYQRAGELLEEVLAARSSTPSRRTPRPSGMPPPSGGGNDTGGADEIQTRLRAREAPQAPKFCWHCRKPLHARADRCPFCGEGQS
jgi:hypothetical protein